MNSETNGPQESQENPTQTCGQFLTELTKEYWEYGNKNRPASESESKDIEPKPVGTIAEWFRDKVKKLIDMTTVPAENLDMETEWREPVLENYHRRIAVFAEEVLTLLPPDIQNIVFPRKITSHIESFLSTMSIQWVKGDNLKQKMAFHSLISYLDVCARNQK